ncbi:MAG: amylo-alpha-1,6-glucosidase [Candidatus Bathyarchaeia archaeon]
MITPKIKVGKNEILNFNEALGKEWITTNSLGGYASSTILNINTRKYHGLLVASFNPPRDRSVCVAKIDEALLIKDNIHPIFANEFQWGISPNGHKFLKEFSISPFPKHVYTLENVEISRTIFMPRGKNAVIAIYEVLNWKDQDFEINVFPLLACRHFHSVVNRKESPLKFFQKPRGKQTELLVENPKTVLIFGATEGVYCQEERWVENVFFREEHARGESCIEDWYKPGFFKIHIERDTRKNFAFLAAASEAEGSAIQVWRTLPYTMDNVEALYLEEIGRREELLANFYDRHRTLEVSDWLSMAVLAADMFIVGDRWKSVIAGYHWFEDWGRDTFISMPGLMLITGRFEDAKNVFLTFNSLCRQGLIPNFISDRESHSAYNSVDATLWFFNAVLQYLKYTGDFQFVKENLWENMKLAVENLTEGKFSNMHMDKDNLLWHAPQLTWMDAAVDGKPVTPRGGKAVEVQALWYNTLKTAEVLARKFKEEEKAEDFSGLAEKAKISFNEKFWNPNLKCLFDVIDDKGVDESIRPNQLIAAALDFTMLEKDKCEKILDMVGCELLTPYGLRTLSKKDPRYVGVYFGDRGNRDKAYHNGTVWPWLLGFFIKAFIKVKGCSEHWREYAWKNFLSPLFSQQFYMAGLGVISEVFDGDVPHTPRGCIAQAWSLAEPLRAYIEDIMQLKPKYEGEILQGLC